MLDEREKPPLGDGGLSRTSSAGCFDILESNTTRPNTQIKFQDPATAGFDPEIAIILVNSGWRAAAALLMHAVACAEAGDLLSAERNRQRARGLFIEANDTFKQLQEAARLAGIMTEAAQ